MPEPVLLSGSGDNIVDVEKFEGPAIVHIVGNSAGRHFAVSNYGAGGQAYDLLVNTTDPYDSVRPLDFMADQETIRFEVSASGPWTIEILPLMAVDLIEVPGDYSSSGDNVLGITGNPDTAFITGNAAGRHFAIIAYGRQVDLLVNTTDPYEGRVIVSSDAQILEIKSEDTWTIEME